MNEKLKKFAELCAQSRISGLTTAEHKKKKTLLAGLITDGLMYDDEGVNRFRYLSDSILFSDIVSQLDAKEEKKKK